jgi:DNA processing protein
MSEPASPEFQALLALHLVPGIGPRLTASLLERFGSARAALQARPEELRGIPYFGDKLVKEVSQARTGADVAGELELIARHGVRVLTKADAEYPAPLKDIYDPPHLLYVRGTLQPGDLRAVALVGSRQCTPYGRKVAQRLAADLVRAGYTIISGMARGIDGAAHRGALDAGGRTLAVLAGGLSRIYPPEHADLAREVESSGAVLSEAAMRQDPMAGMFPARNRLISGLSRGVVIIEAAERSGALITAEHAAEQGRSVFAVPGPVDSEASSGTLRLIRDGAILVRSAEDILEDLDGVAAVASAPKPPPMPAGLDATQQRLWEFLAGRPRHVDEMAQQLGLAVPQITGALMMLEMKKIVRRLPGNQYERRG